MARLSPHGVALVSSSELSTNLDAALERLGIARRCNKKARNEVVDALSIIMGRWAQERDRVESRIVTAKLHTLARNLSDTSKLLEATEGLHRTEDIETVNELCTALARSPGIEISPRNYLEDFSRRSHTNPHIE